MLKIKRLKWPSVPGLGQYLPKSDVCVTFVQPPITGLMSDMHFSFEQLISATRQWQGDGNAERLEATSFQMAAL